MTRATFRDIAALTQPTRYLDHKDYLAEVYRQIKTSKGGSYSYIRFTADLGLGDCNVMYLIIHGQRPLTVKTARRIAAALGLTGLDRQYFLKLVEYSHVGEPEARDAAMQEIVALKSKALPTELDRRQLEFFNQWYNAAILELMGLPEASDDPKEIARRLVPPVPPAKVARSLELLQSLGYLTRDEATGRLVPSQAVVSTGEEAFGLAIVRYHQQMIELAKEAISRVHADDREISAVTMKIPKVMTSLIRHEIAALRRRLIELSNNATGADEIVQVNFQMFPLVKSD